MEITQVLILFCVGIILLLNLKSAGRVGKFMKMFPGPGVIPLIGNAWYFFNSDNLLKIITRLGQNYGNRVGIILCNIKVLFLFHPDDIEKILTTRENNKSRIYDLLFSDLFGADNMFFAKGKEYLKKRKMMNPAYHYKRLEDNLKITFNEHSKNLVDILKDKETRGETVEINGLFTLCILDMISEYLWGKSTHSLNQIDHELANVLYKLEVYVSQRSFSPWFWLDFFWKLSPTYRKEKVKRKFLDDFTDKIIQERKREILSTQTVESFDENKANEEKGHLLDFAIYEHLHGQNGMTESDIRSQLHLAIFASHETVTFALSSVAYLLASHPEEQEKLHAELDSVFGDDRNRSIDTSDLTKLKFLECCIKESMRLYSPVTKMFRAIETDFELDENTIIPKGTQIGVSQWVTHRLPQFWPEPDKFTPSRFFPENSAGRHPYCYFPFSGGARNCIGQKIGMRKMQTVLAYLFRQFQVELDSPNQKFVVIPTIVCFPNKGLKLKLKLR